MKSLQNIFNATIKENKKEKNLPNIICDLTYELSKKRINRLKDEKRIQVRLGELFELYSHSLSNENLDTKENIEAVISGLIKASNYDKEEFLYKTIYEKEQLEKSIEEQKNTIRNSILGTFDVIEAHIEKLEGLNLEEFLQAISDAKLKSVEMLGILRETVSEALLTTLERAEDIEDTAYEITKNITYQTINEGEFSKRRFLDISKTSLDIVNKFHDIKISSIILIQGVYMGNT